MKNNWNVVKKKVAENASGTPILLREYIYGDLKYIYTKEDMKDIEVIPYEKWTADDFAEILANEYEDANYHNFVDLPKIILYAIRAQGLGLDVQDALMRRICERLYEVI